MHLGMDRLDTLIHFLQGWIFSTKQVVSSVTVTVSAAVTNAGVQVVGANPNRRGLILYNTGGNQAWVAFKAGSDADLVGAFKISANDGLVLPQPIYTGAVYGLRGSGSSPFVVTEFV